MTEKTLRRILSGIRPTGTIHLGNYLGAVKQWVDGLDTADENLICIVDLHALDTIQEGAKLQHNSELMAATLLACGLDPQKSHLFKQSAVPAHTQLCWILSSITPLGWLNRMTQFKEKAGKNLDTVCLGLYAYPVLQAADILIYKATHVPVGEDQKQHIELSRDIAQMFNRRFEKEYFNLPEPVIQGPATRIMSLRDGTSKMSKSDLSDYSRIHLTDDADTIAKKIKKAKTDPEMIAGSIKEMAQRPEAINLINMLAALTEQKPDDVCTQFTGQNFSALKDALITACHEIILPIGNRIQELMQDKKAISTVLQNGANYANTLAQKHLKEIYEIVGI